MTAPLPPYRANMMMVVCVHSVNISVPSQQCRAMQVPSAVAHIAQRGLVQYLKAVQVEPGQIDVQAAMAGQQHQNAKDHGHRRCNARQLCCESMRALLSNRLRCCACRDRQYLTHSYHCRNCCSVICSADIVFTAGEEKLQQLRIQEVQTNSHQ